MKGYKLLFEQDDCAPDSLKQFNKELKEDIDCNFTIKDFTKNARLIHAGKLETSFYLGNYLLTLNVDGPYWKLYIKE